MFGAFTIGEPAVPEAPARLGVREGSLGDVAGRDAVPELEEAEALGPRRKVNLKGRTLEGAAVEDEAATALDGTEPKRDPPLLEEAVDALDGTKPENGAPLDEKDLAALEASLNQLTLAESKRLPGVAVFCDGTALEPTLKRLVDEGAPEEAAVEEETLAALVGYRPKGLLEDAVCCCVAVLITGPKTPPESSMFCGAEASDNTLEGAAMGEEAVAEPKSDPPSDWTWGVLRGDGRCGAEL